MTNYQVGKAGWDTKSYQGNNTMTKLKVSLSMLFLFALYYLIPIEFRSLWQPDETRYAEISREMLAHGDWVVPHFFDLRYFEKPIAGYWINSLGQWLFGGSNFAVRFGAIFSTAVTALMVYWLTWQMWRDKKTAFIAAVIFLSCLLVYGVGTYAVLDPIITLWLMAAMCVFWLALQSPSTHQKVWAYLLLGSVCAMGLMTKGFLALAIPVIGSLPWVIQQQRWKELLLFVPLTVVSAVLTGLPWALAIAQREPDFWHYFFWIEHVQRFFADNAQHKAPFWYYLPCFLAGCLPWTGLMPGALWRGWALRKQCSGSFYLLGWAVMPILFFSVAKGKLLTYIMPCFAPLAILMAGYARQLMVTDGLALRINGWINVLFGTLGTLIVLGGLAPWSILEPVYSENELNKVLLAGGAFLLWMLVGAFTLKSSVKRWLIAALCPLGVALVIGSVIPHHVIDAKHPQRFISAVRSDISGSRYLLADSVGTAAGIAWELQRSDIYFYANKGELSYGLDYPDAHQRFIDVASFPRWLAEHRREGSVSLILLLDHHQDDNSDHLPTADLTYRSGRFVLYHYYQQK